MDALQKLDAIRRYALWTAIVSAGGWLVLRVLFTWEVVDEMETPNLESLFDPFASSVPDLSDLFGYTEWGKLGQTFMITLFVSLVVVLAMLIASRIQTDKLPVKED